MSVSVSPSYVRQPFLHVTDRFFLLVCGFFFLDKCAEMPVARQMGFRSRQTVFSYRVFQNSDRTSSLGRGADGALLILTARLQPSKGSRSQIPAGDPATSQHPIICVHGALVVLVVVVFNEACAETHFGKSSESSKCPVHTGSPGFIFRQIIPSSPSHADDQAACPSLR